MEIPLANESRLLMIGDSITDCGRAHPIGEGSTEHALGHGYVSFIGEILGRVCPEKSVHLINMGISGNTVVDLKNRWQRDVFDLQPDWVSVKIGINDVWREIEPSTPDSDRIPIDLFKQLLEELVKSTRTTVKGMILATPYLIESDATDPMRVKMDDYGRVVRDLSERYTTIFVDTQAAFDEVLAQHPRIPLAADRVHPNEIGHMISPGHS